MFANELRKENAEFKWTLKYLLKLKYFEDAHRKFVLYFDGCR